MDTPSWAYWVGTAILVWFTHYFASRRSAEHIEQKEITAIKETLSALNTRLTLVENTAINQDQIVSIIHTHIRPQLNGIAGRIPQQNEIRDMIIDVMRVYENRVDNLSVEFKELKDLLGQIQIAFAQITPPQQ